MSNLEDRHSALVGVWQEINDSIQALAALGFDADRGVVESLIEAQRYLSDDIDELEVQMEGEE